MEGLTTSSVGDPFWPFPVCVFPLAQGCRKGGPHTKWFGENQGLLAPTNKNWPEAVLNFH